MITASPSNIICRSPCLLSDLPFWAEPRGAVEGAMATGLAAATVAAADAAGRKRFLPLRLWSLPLARWLNRRLFLEENEREIR